MLRKAYIESLAGSVSSDLSGMRVLVDCANGAATAEAPELFRGMGIQATFTCVTPDGKNINEGCGALHPETLGKTVAASGGKFDLGVTFDGDADRALFCDARARGEWGWRVAADGARYAGAWEVDGRYSCRDDNVEYGSGDRAEEVGHSHVAGECRRQICSGRDAEDGRYSGWRAVGAHYFSRWRCDYRRWSVDCAAGDGCDRRVRASRWRSW